MSVSHPTAVRNGLADFVCGLLNAGSPPGKLKLLTAADAIVATLTLSNPAFQPASGGSAVSNPAADPAAVGGTVAKATLTNGAGAIIVHCSVTATGGGGDLLMQSVAVTPGEVLILVDVPYVAPL